MRTIVHLDADAFFASVEQAANASLRGKPVAVGGERRGIIASASYEARKFGVYTPMPTARARKLCPKLIVLPGDFERYEQFSNWMFGYAYDFTPDVEQTSIDEGYFDLTANRQKPPVEIAQTIRAAIRQSLKISVSEGLGSNKLVSQIASKLHKPAAFTAVPAGGEISFLHPLPNRWLPGVGPKTSERLDAAGLAKVHHIAATPMELLELLLGKLAFSLKEFANGHDDRPLIPAREPQKSFTQQETFAEDQTDEEYLEATLRRMADRLFAKVREERRSIRTLTVRVRYNDMAEDQCSESLREPTDLETDVYGRLAGMLKQAWKRRVSLRLVSLKLSNVYAGVFRSELPLETNARQYEARERLARVVDELRRVKGTTVLLRGHDFTLRLKPDELTEKNPKSEIRNPKEIRNSKSESEPVAQVPKPAVSPISKSADCTTTHNPQVLKPAMQQTWKSALLLRTGSSNPRPFAIGHRPSAQAHVPLHVHSYYSFLDSTLSPKAIVALAKRHGCPAIALTDTGNLHGAVEFTLAARQAGIKPILGAEVRVDGAPLLLYVESARGYANLCRLLSANPRSRPSSSSSIPPLSFEDENEGRERKENAGSVADFHRRNFSREDLARFTEGLLAVSSDARLADLFPGRFYQAASPADVAAARQSAANFDSESSDG
ncbi:MAG TPA: DNA polymerase IV, partial [Verrucomicrobiae bacterium]